MSLLAAVKARVAEDKARHSEEQGSGLCLGCVGADWPCDAARHISVSEARLEWIEERLSPIVVFPFGTVQDAESELSEMAKLLGVQG